MPGLGKTVGSSALEGEGAGGGGALPAEGKSDFKLNQYPIPRRSCDMGRLC